MGASIDRHVQVRDAQGVAIVDTLPEACRACQMPMQGTETTRSCGFPGKRKRGFLTLPHGSVFVCTNDPNLIDSSRLFKKELEFYADALARLEQLKGEIARAEAHKTRRLLHNLISLNAHALQELYSVVPQDELGILKGIRSQQDAVSRILRRDPDACAMLFIKALKNAAAVKTELAVFQKLHDPSPTLKFGSHQIHRVLVNVVNYFFQDFADKQVRILIDGSEVKLRLDYESIQVALYHLLDNAAKYALPGSELRISFSDRRGFQIRFDMTSLFVPAEERGRIQADGFSGSQAKAISKDGQGLGMGVVAELLKMNGAKLESIWGDALSLAPSMPSDSPRYAHNTLVIEFGSDSVLPGRR